MQGRRIGRHLVTGLLQSTFDRFTKGGIIVNNVNEPRQSFNSGSGQCSTAPTPLACSIVNAGLLGQLSLSEGGCRKNGTLVGRSEGWWNCARTARLHLSGVSAARKSVVAVPRERNVYRPPSQTGSHDPQAQ